MPDVPVSAAHLQQQFGANKADPDQRHVAILAVELAVTEYHRAGTPSDKSHLNYKFTLVLFWMT